MTYCVTLSGAAAQLPRSRTGLCPAARGLYAVSVAQQTVYGSRGDVPKISRLRRRNAAAPLEMTQGAYAHTPPIAARSFSPLQARETYIFKMTRGIRPYAAAGAPAAAFVSRKRRQKPLRGMRHHKSLGAAAANPLDTPPRIGYNKQQRGIL